MSVKILVDMNLSPFWVDVLSVAGWPTVHWSKVGDARAPDRAIMDWALAHAHVVFTHDLDFGAALALTYATGPSVILLRGPDVMPDGVAGAVIAALAQHKSELAAGALVVVDAIRKRVRILPL